MLDEDGLLELVRFCDVDSGGLRFLDELFAKLKLTMASERSLMMISLPLCLNSTGSRPTKIFGHKMLVARVF